mmetsp:Transcript_21013/g.36078  ORF Transcript_21013/g.36078 Transcript_21013/m.36078 type:complete len:272 (-) Transcript_21013:754-1569(-)
MEVWAAAPAPQDLPESQHLEVLELPLEQDQDPAEAEEQVVALVRLEVLVEGGVGDTEDVLEAEELRMHARLPFDEVALHTVFVEEGDEGPKALLLRLEHVQEWRQHVAHALAVPHVEVVERVRRQDITQQLHVRVVLPGKERHLPVRASHVLVDAAPPVLELSESSFLGGSDRRPLGLVHHVLGQPSLIVVTSLLERGIPCIDAEKKLPHHRPDLRADAPTEDSFPNSLRVRDAAVDVKTADPLLGGQLTQSRPELHRLQQLQVRTIDNIE